MPSSPALQGGRGSLLVPKENMCPLSFAAMLCFQKLNEVRALRFNLNMSGYAIPPTPNRGAPYLTASTAQICFFGSPRFRRICFLAAQPGPGTARNEKVSMVGCSGLDSQLLGTILKPFPTTFADLGPCPAADTVTPCHFIFFGFSATRHGTMPIGTAPRLWI